MAQRRLLLVSYHFPPSETAGALRWQRFTPIAVEHGWDVHAITLDPDQAERVDWARVSELPPQIQIHGVPESSSTITRMDGFLRKVWLAVRRPTHASAKIGASSSPFAPSYHRDELTWMGNGTRSLLRIRNVVLAQALERAWAREAVKTGLRHWPSFSPDLVVSCGPPHLVHEAGRRLARRFRVPFVMDMRDPWSIQTRLQEDWATPLWHVLARRAEARCVKQASLIIMNTPIATQAMERVWPGRRVITVLNGWDDEPLPQRPWPSQFRIVFAGSIYLDRTPRPFLRALAHLVKELRLTPSQVELRLIGSVQVFGKESVSTIAEEEGVRDYLRLLPVVSRKDVLEEYAQAAVLLSLPQDSYYAIPSKIYEYMRQPCWILAQATKDSATGELLRDTTAYAADPDDTEGMKAFLLKCYREFQQGKRPLPAAVVAHSRVSQGAKLMRELESLVDRR